MDNRPRDMTFVFGGKKIHRHSQMPLVRIPATLVPLFHPWLSVHTTPLSRHKRDWLRQALDAELWRLSRCLAVAEYMCSLCVELREAA